MPTIPQEIAESTEKLVDNTGIVDQFVHGPETIFIQVRGGALRPLLYWQGYFQDKVVELADPYVQQATDAAEATEQDAQATAADRIATGEDATATAADRVATGEDRTTTELDAQATADDRIATGEDATATAADRVATGEDRTATQQDAQATAADRIATGEDATATAADRVATGEDRTATEQDAQATAADRLATGEDATATAADRVATGEDAASSETAATTATSQAGRAETEADRAQGYADGLNLPSATGNGSKILRQKTDESGFEYIEQGYSQTQADGRFAQLDGPNDFTTMPTVGGAPVVESGANSDGEWTRWGDGTQQCRMKVVIYMDDELFRNRPYALPFASSRVFLALSFSRSSINGTQSTYLNGLPYCMALEESAIGYTHVYRPGSSGQGIHADLYGEAFTTASGRWK